MLTLGRQATVTTFCRFFDHFIITAINTMRWSGSSGEGWSTPAFIPHYCYIWAINDYEM